MRSCVTTAESAGTVRLIFSINFDEEAFQELVKKPTPMEAYGSATTVPVDFLRDFRSRIHLSNAFSALCQQENEMPHVSVLSETLFASRPAVWSASLAFSLSIYVEDIASIGEWSQ